MKDQITKLLSKIENGCDDVNLELDILFGKSYSRGDCVFCSKTGFIKAYPTDYLSDDVNLSTLYGILSNGWQLLTIESFSNREEVTLVNQNEEAWDGDFLTVTGVGPNLQTAWVIAYLKALIEVE